MPATAVPRCVQNPFEIRAVTNIIALVIFAIVAVVILVQLYSVLGRKVGFRVEDKVPAKQPVEGSETKLELERPAEPPKFPNLDVLKSRDVNFNEINFVEKARETYEQVVQAYHRGELESVKDRLTDKVYSSFAKAAAERSTPVRSRLSFVETPKADIDLIEVRDDTAQIRVRFLSELMYEDEASEGGSAPEKTYRRTAEFWTFQKLVKSPANPWLLAKVEAAKA